MAQYVFSMNRVTKTVPPKRQILKDVSISFFPGAKIGVLGLNGSGKATCRRSRRSIPSRPCARRWKRASAAR
jgi:ABC-type polysaccharide/polyol phosphate transport system ATPase subunit